MQKQSKTILMILVILLSLTTTITFYIPCSTALDGPWFIYGNVEYSNGTAVPDGTTVTLTDTTSSNSMTTTTSGGDGSYSADMYDDMPGNQDDGDTIRVNCTVSGEGGENMTTIVDADQWGWCNLTLEPANININPNSWNLSTVNMGSVKYSNASGTTFNLTNDGGVSVNITIDGHNISWNGNSWTLNTTADHDKYGMQYKKSGGSWTEITYSNDSFATNLAVDDSILFDLKLMVAASSSVDPPWLNANLTFWAVIA